MYHFCTFGINMNCFGHKATSSNFSQTTNFSKTFSPKDFISQLIDRGMVMRLSATALNNLRSQIKLIASQSKLHVHGFGLHTGERSFVSLDDSDNISILLS